jgi:hypothetical protein
MKVATHSVQKGQSTRDKINVGKQLQICFNFVKMQYVSSGSE